MYSNPIGTTIDWPEKDTRDSIERLDELKKKYVNEFLTDTTEKKIRHDCDTILMDVYSQGRTTKLFYAHVTIDLIMGASIDFKDYPQKVDDPPIYEA